MKYEFYVDIKVNIIFERFEGEIDYQSLKEAIQQSFEHPDWVKDLNVLCDLRDASLSFSSEKMKRVIESFSPEDQSNKLAMIVSNDLEFGMSRMFEILSEDTPVWKEYQIFRNINDAKQWLGIESYTNPDIKWLN